MNVKKGLFNNWRLKLISLILALLLWSHVASDKEYVIESKIPLEVKGFPRNTLSLVYPPPETVTLKLTGKGRTLLTFNPSRLKAEIILNQRNTGSGTYRLTQKDIIIPKKYDLKVLSVYNPQIVSYELDSLSSRPVEVSAVFKGELPEGYVHTGESRAEPQSVVIRGPKKVIRNMRKISTEPISLENHNDDFNDTVPVHNDHPFIEVEPDSVAVYYKIEKIVQRRLAGMPVYPFPAVEHRSYTIDPDRIDLLVEGAESSIRSMDLKEVSVKIIVKGMETGDYIRKAQIKLPPGIRLVSATPENFQVTIE
jgi:YbbR domain-containing protein